MLQLFFDHILQDYQMVDNMDMIKSTIKLQVVVIVLLLVALIALIENFNYLI